MAEKEVEIREANWRDAENLITFFNQVGSETPFLTIDEAGIDIPQDKMTEFLRQMEQKDNAIYLLSLVDDEIVGLIGVTSDSHKRISHIGQVLIAIKKDYWGAGLASILFEVMIDWVEKTQKLHRLELTVQTRNERAVELYKKYKFQIEAEQKYGARDENGHLISTYLMSRIFD